MGQCYEGDGCIEAIEAARNKEHIGQPTPPTGNSPAVDGIPTDMFGNDLTRTDSFGTPRAESDPWKAVHRIKLKYEAALREGIDALRDIINAAGNGQPYNAEELERLFSGPLEQMRQAVGDV